MYYKYYTCTVLCVNPFWLISSLAKSFLVWNYVLKRRIQSCMNCMWYSRTWPSQQNSCSWVKSMEHDDVLALCNSILHNVTLESVRIFVSVITTHGLVVWQSIGLTLLWRGVGRGLNLPLRKTRYVSAMVMKPLQTDVLIILAWRSGIGESSKVFIISSWRFLLHNPNGNILEESWMACGRRGLWLPLHNNWGNVFPLNSCLVSPCTIASPTICYILHPLCFVNTVLYSTENIRTCPLLCRWTLQVSVTWFIHYVWWQWAI